VLLIVGIAIGAVIAQRAPITSMRELVAAFHSLVGMAARLVPAGAFCAPKAFDIEEYAGRERTAKDRSITF
jgi:NAD(P) transhydrogenase subunit beta